MNTLKDTLTDLVFESSKITKDNFAEIKTVNERIEGLVEEYIERIKNELNIEKYLK